MTASTPPHAFRTRHDSGLPPPPGTLQARLSHHRLQRIKADLIKPRPPIPQHCTCPRCAPTLYSPPRHHPADTPHLLNIQGLRSRSHDAWHLAHLATHSFAPTTTPTQRQHDALQEWKRWWADSTASPTWQPAPRKRKKPHARKETPTPSLWTPDLATLDIQTLTRAAHLLDTIFFLSALQSTPLTLRWSDPSFPQTHRGLTTSTSSPHHVLIRLNPTHPQHLLNPRALLSTLLHELAHAFLTLHARPHDARVHVGVTGHGRAWQVLARGVEEAMPRLLGFEGGLGRAEGLVAELRAEGGWRPGERCEGGFLGEGWEGMVGRAGDDLEVLRRERRGREARQRGKARRKSFAIGQRRNPFFWP